MASRRNDPGVVIPYETSHLDVLGQRFVQLVVPPHSLVGENQPLKSKFPSKEIRRWQEGGKGMFARRIGNLPQAFSCVPRIAPIMEMDSCWVEVPVLANGKVQFVEVETLVFKVQGAKEPYNRLLSLTIRGAEDGLEGAVNPFSGL